MPIRVPSGFTLASLLGLAACASANPSAAPPEPSPRMTPRNTASLAPNAARPPSDAPNNGAAAPSEPDPQPESLPIANSELVRGRATVTVKAPIEKVREAVLAFAQYPEF